jgi:hypothetical protein
LGEWNLFIYLALIVYGSVLSATTDFASLARRYRGVALLAALIPGFLAQHFDGAVYGSPGYFVGFAARGLFMWCLLILLVGLFYTLRDKYPPFLRYAAEMGMPFYILHQPVILAVDLLILHLDLPPLVKYAAIIGICLPLIVGVYEYLVRRFNPVRVLFGMRSTR